MGLKAAKESNGLYLSIAGGFIWDRKADKSDENYDTQTFERADGTEGERSGAKYGELTGIVTDVEFRTHDKYGESINVKVTSDGEDYIMSISTNNRYSQDMMKCLLKMDTNKELFIKPYDFVGKDGKRAQGISFRQDGEKIDLKIETPDEFQKGKDWFKKAKKKDIKRYFEDLSDWFVGEVEEKVRPLFLDKNVEEVKDVEVEEEEVVEEPKVTPIKMRKFLKAYISENYEDEELPKLDKEDLIKWYNIALEDEELPFDVEEEFSQDEDDANVDDAELQAQLDALAG